MIHLALLIVSAVVILVAAAFAWMLIMFAYAWVHCKAVEAWAAFTGLFRGESK